MYKFDVGNTESLLLQCIEDQDELVVFKAITTLGKVGSKDVIPSMKKARGKIGNDLQYCVDDAIDEIISRD